jgi:hypothetical protein
MEKGLLFFTLAVICLWLLLDDFFGDKRVSKLAMSVTPDVRTPIDDVKQKIEKVKEHTDEVHKKETKKAVEKGTVWGQFYKKYIMERREY